ncbi:hypothetical protein AM1141 [Anaplasma marginale str. St. Maries]|nr:hypothetical protein AM1141 [Anaplasma marginale str. St. Maries]
MPACTEPLHRAHPPPRRPVRRYQHWEPPRSRRWTPPQREDKAARTDFYDSYTNPTTKSHLNLKTITKCTSHPGDSSEVTYTKHRKDVRVHRGYATTCGTQERWPTPSMFFSIRTQVVRLSKQREPRAQVILDAGSAAPRQHQATTGPPIIYRRNPEAQAGIKPKMPAERANAGVACAKLDGVQADPRNLPNVILGRGPAIRGDLAAWECKPGSVAAHGIAAAVNTETAAISAELQSKRVEAVAQGTRQTEAVFIFREVMRAKPVTRGRGETKLCKPHELLATLIDSQHCTRHSVGLYGGKAEVGYTELPAQCGVKAPSPRVGAGAHRARSRHQRPTCKDATTGSSANRHTNNPTNRPKNTPSAHRRG